MIILCTNKHTCRYTLANCTEMITCKFSNEACQAKEECCSSNCLQAHPGTNPRCMRSTLNDSCLYNYQCEDSLVCGPFNRCCSKYWGICSRHDDCCHATFRCLEAEGFYYKRCLMQETNRANIPVQGLFAKNIWDLLLLMSLVFLFLC